MCRGPIYPQLFWWGKLDINFKGKIVCQSYVRAIKLNVPRHDFSSITIEVTFVTCGHGFKKAGSVLFDICVPGTRTFKYDNITWYLHNWVALRLWIVFTVGESRCVCSKYNSWYYLLLIWGGTRVSAIATGLQWKSVSNFDNLRS